MAGKDTKVLIIKMIGESTSAQTSFSKVGASARTAGKHMTAAGAAAKKTGEQHAVAAAKVGGFAKDMAKGMLAAAGLTYGLTKTVEGIKDMIHEAVDLEKSQQRVNKLFGSNSGQITKWAEGAATSLGLSTNQAETAAAQFALYGQTAKLTGSHLVTFSEQNTKLAVDLASFKNVDPSLTFKAMSSALGGNFKAMKQFGVVIDSTQVKQQAMKMGLIKTTKEALTPQQRVLAVQQLLIQKTSFAMDDFGKHSASAANKHKILSARIADVKEKLGTALLPVLKSFMDMVGTKIVPALTQFVGGLTGSKDATGGFAVAGRTLRDVLREMSAAIGAVVGWMSQHKTATRDLAIAFGVLWLAVKLYNIQQAITIALTAAGGFGGYIKQVKVVTLVTKAWAAAGFLLNSALLTNPIGLVIVALVALGIAFYIAWTKSATFRKIVIATWHGILVASKAVADFFMKYVWPTISWVWRNIELRIIRLYVAYFKIYFGLIKWIVSTCVAYFKGVLWPAITWVWNNIGIKVVWLYVHIFKVYFGLIKWWISGWIAFIKGVLWPAVSWTFNKIWGITSWLYNKVFKPYFGLIRNVLQGTINFFKHDLVNGISAGIWGAYFVIKKAIGYIKGGFKSGVDFITSIWGTLVKKLSDVVGQIGDKVYTHGIKKLWDNVAGRVGLPKLPDFHFAGGGAAWKPPGGASANPTKSGGGPNSGHPGVFASGGWVTGRGGPRQDMIPARLSNGEFVVNAKQAGAHRSLLERINSGMLSFAGGGAVGAIEALQRMVGPGLRVTSTTGGRHAKNSYHYRGMAVDFAGSARAMDIAANNLMRFAPYILELIHSPNWFVKNYHRTGRSTYASVYNEHFNHVHLAMSLAGAMAAIAAKKTGKFGSFQGAGGPGSGMVDPMLANISRTGAMKYFAPAYKAARGIGGWGGQFGKTLTDKMVTETNKQVAAAVAQAAQTAANFSTSPTNLGGMGGRVAGWISQASKYANIPQSWVRGLEFIISHESGGNPRAFNASGASGIMQTMLSTFRHYHAFGTSNSVWDPVANIAAASNYIHARWGSPYGTPWYNGGHWYDQGGWVQPGTTMVHNNSGKAEWLGSGGPGGDIHLHFHFDGPVTGSERTWVRKVMPTLRDEVIKASSHRGKPYFEA